MNKITPHLWYDKEAKEAAEFYCALFPDSKITNVTTLHNTPSGDADIVSFELIGQNFMAISAGPFFKLNESISLFAYCESDEKIEQVYHKLCEGGKILFPLDKYDWSPKYAWVVDKFGLSWQLDVEKINNQQKILPALLFVNDKVLKVKEAAEFYCSVFPNSKIMMEFPYDKSAGLPDGALLFTQFKLSDYLFNAMSGQGEHKFDFNEAMSFMVNLDTQEEIDYYWEKLSAVPESEQCGWCKDKFGVSWQIVPSILGEMMSKGTREQIDRLTQAFLPMKKFNIAEVEKAFKNY
ncbi:MAG: VOC family protein [Ignavibacterium sp.]|nr:VOC family protein [Ignavibacterium sp.]